MSKNKFILLDCPFCGAEPCEYDYSDYDSTFQSWIQCTVCFAQSPKTHTLYASTLLWNKRAGDEYETL